MAAHPLVLPVTIATAGLAGMVAFLSYRPLHVVTDVRPRLGKTPDERDAEEAEEDPVAHHRLRHHRQDGAAVSGIGAYELRQRRI